METKKLRLPTFLVSLFACLCLLFTGCSCSNKLEDYKFTSMTEENIKNNDNKINVYVFWAASCGECKKLLSWLNTLDKSTRDKFDLYTFELKESEDKAELLLKEFEIVTNSSFEGTPYIVIGDTGFSEGFPKSMKKRILDKIDSELKKDKKDRIDSFDKIKENRNKGEN